MKRELRVLMLEDTPTDAELMERELRKGGIAFTSRRVERRAAFVQALAEFRPDIVLSDYKLPDFNGMDALEIVRRDHPEVPVVMVTGALSDIDAVELIHAGAKDYVLKDRLARLAPAVQRVLAAAQIEAARKSAEMALRESEAKFRALVETSSDWVWEVDANGTYTYASPKVERLLGFKPEEVVGKTPFDLMSQEERRRVAPLFLAARQARQPLELLLNTNLHKDGHAVLMETSGTPILDPQGNVTGYRGIDRDITERKRAEAERLAQLQFFECMDRVNRALQGSNDLERMMSDVLDAALSIFDADRAYLIYPCDPQVASWSVPMERTKPEYPGANVRGLVLSMDPENQRVFRTIRDSDGPVAFGPGSGFALPERLREKFGVQSQLAMAIYPKLDAPYMFGLHQCSYGRVWTPQEHRLMQEIGRRLGDALTSLLSRRDLQESETKYRRIVNTASEGIWGLGPDAMTTFVNARMAEMLGHCEAEIIGRPETDFMFEEDVRDHARRMENRRQGLSERYEQRLRGQDEQAIWTLVSATPILEDEHQFKGTFAMFTDITERKHAELALARANRALRTLSACNVELVRAGNEPELLNAICRLLVEIGGYRMAWVGFPEQDAARTVRPVAHYGHEEGYLATAGISWADTELGRGPTGTAIRIGSVQVNQSFLANPMMTPWREEASKRGYRSNIALPLKSATDTLGALTIYASESDAFNEAELSLLQELAEDLAFGIQNLRTRLERDRIAHENLQHAEVLRQSLEESIKAIANTVEMRDPYTAGHQRRVGQLAVAIAKELGLPEDTNHGIELAASIHDLGKISIPAEILSKPSTLTAIEFMLLKNHAQAGYDILKDIEFPWPIASMVLQHHERLDGSGYPQGLKGEQILLESRILAVADVVEAMASHRPYRAALGSDSALKEIERGRGMVYDAAVVDACQRLFTQKRFAWPA